MKNKTTKKPQDPLQKVAHRLNYQEGLRLFLKEQKEARNFFVFPQVQDLETQPYSFLNDLRAQCEQGYMLRKMEDLFVGEHNRLGHYFPLLSLSDHVLYNTLFVPFLPGLTSCLPFTPIEEAFGLENSVWKKFNKDRLASTDKLMLAQPTKRVPTAIAAELEGYYSNIDPRKLRYRLQKINPPTPFLEALLHFLHLWSQGGGKGLPDGYGVSQLLAELYYQDLWKQIEPLTSRPDLTYLHYSYFTYTRADETWSVDLFNSFWNQLEKIFGNWNLSLQNGPEHPVVCNIDPSMGHRSEYDGWIIGPHYRLLSFKTQLSFMTVLCSDMFVHPVLLGIYRGGISTLERYQIEMQILFNKWIDKSQVIGGERDESAEWGKEREGGQSGAWRYAVLHWYYHHRDHIPNLYKFLQFCRYRAYRPEVHFTERMYYHLILQEWGVEKDHRQLQQWQQTGQVTLTEWNRYPDRDTFLDHGIVV